MSAEHELSLLIEASQINCWSPLLKSNNNEQLLALWKSGRVLLDWIPLHAEFEGRDAGFQDVLEYRRATKKAAGTSPKLCWKSTDVCRALMVLNAPPTHEGFLAPTLGYSERRRYTKRAESTLQVAVSKEAPIRCGVPPIPVLGRKRKNRCAYLVLAIGRCEDVRSNSMVATEIAYQRVYSHNWLFPSDSADEDFTLDLLKQQRVLFFKALLPKTAPRRFIIAPDNRLVMDVTHVVDPPLRKVSNWHQSSNFKYVALDAYSKRHRYSLGNFRSAVLQGLDEPW